MNLYDEIEKLAQANTLYQNQKDAIDLLDDAIPREANPDQLVRQLEGLVSRHPATILSVSVGEAVIVGPPGTTGPIDKNIDPYPDGAQELSFTINATGDYHTLANLITDLENLRRPVKVDTLNFSIRESQDGKDQLILVINSRVPYIYTNSNQ